MSHMSLLVSLRMRTAACIRLGRNSYHVDLVVSRLRHVAVAYSVKSRDTRLFCIAIRLASVRIIIVRLFRMRGFIRVHQCAVIRRFAPLMGLVSCIPLYNV